MTVREQKWDNLKFILIFLVVLGHIADIYAEISPVTGYIRFFIYTFHMPLFIFVSGLFCKNTVNKRKYNKIFSYLVLYLVIKILNFFARWAAEGSMPAFRLLYEGSTPWYAFSLFAFCLITIALKNFNKKYVLVLSIIFALIIGYDNKIGDYLCLSRIIVYYPFYYLGYILDAKKVENELNKKSIKIFSILFLIISVIFIVVFYDEINVLKFLFTGRNSYHDVFNCNLPWAFLMRFVCYLFAFLMGCSVIALTPGKMCNGLCASIGAKSLQIYILHYPLKCLYFGLLNDKFHIDALFTSKIVLYVFIVSIVLMIICALPFWKKPIDKALNG